MTDLPPLPVLAALLRIDLDDPADADDAAALADLLLRRELRGDVPPTCRRLRRACAIRGDRRGTLGGMDPQYAPGPALPDPAAPAGPTRWGAPVRDGVASADGASPWADVAEPAAVPPAIEPRTERVGWLTAGRLDTAA